MHLCVAASPPPLQYPYELTLSSKANALFELVVSVAHKVFNARGYCNAVTQVHFFCPGEIVALALGMARSTMYRKIAELKAAGLIDARAHYVTHEGRTKADGMVWAVEDAPGAQRAG